MKKINLLCIALIFSLCFSANTSAQQAGDSLIVLVKGAKANTGQAIASLFTTADNYLINPVVEQILPINKSGGTQFVFTGLTAGVYAISVVHDEDSNGELNTGLFGIPSEFVGFSNNVRGTFGPPSFEKAAFSFPEMWKISIKLGKAKE